jgi:hypothetical protein
MSKIDRKYKLLEAYKKCYNLLKFCENKKGT